MQFINNLRGLAILLIVATHAVSTLPSLGLIGEFIDYFVGGATLLFMAISGYVFQTALTGFRYLPYLKSKAVYVGVPYLVLSLPANLLYVLGLKADHPWIDMAAFAEMGVVEKCFLLVFTGAGLGPLWFIPMIGIFYVAAPLFSGLSRLKLVLPAFILACGLAVWVGRPPLNDQPFQAFIFFIPAYLLGMLLSANTFTFEGLGSKALVHFVGYMIVYGLAFFGLKLIGSTPDRTGTMLFYLPIIVLLFGVFQQFFRRKDVWLDLFARLSFFIFFIHGYFAALIRSVFAKFVDGYGGLYPVFELPLIVAAFFSMLALSILAYLVLKLFLRERSRLVIGG